MNSSSGVGGVDGISDSLPSVATCEERDEPLMLTPRLSEPDGDPALALWESSRRKLWAGVEDVDGTGRGTAVSHVIRKGEVANVV